MSETKYPTKTKNIKGKKSKNLTRKYDLNRKKAGKTSPGRERKNTHPEKWISPQKNLKNLTRRRDLTKKKAEKLTGKREKIYTPKEMDLTKRSHQKKISHQKS